MRYLFFTIITCFILANALHAQAKDDFTMGSEVTLENTPDAGQTTNNEIVDQPTNNMPDIDRDAEVTIVKSDKGAEYVPLSVQNISKLYWKKGVLPLSNDKAIDNFLLINECDIYTKFIKDDFEWPRVREAGRDMIKQNKDLFPTKFKMIVPIDLGKYDMQRKGFPLISGTGYRNMRRVEIGDNDYRGRICGVPGFIKFYPKNIMMILNKPFIYEFVDVDEHIAQAFIVRRKYEPATGPRYVTRNFKRPAYARIRLSLLEYQGEAKNQQRQRLAIMVGNVDGIDIFEDQGETRLLSSTDFTK